MSFDVLLGVACLIKLIRILVVVVFSWAPESSVEGHISRVKARLARGLKLLQQLAKEPPWSIDVPGVQHDTFFAGAPLPLPNDK